MPIAHVTQSGNISIPKQWRDDLQIDPDSDVLIKIDKYRIIIEPLRKGSLAGAFSGIDEEIKRKGITFSRKEAIKDDLYD